jgi:hypothetical protein
MRPAPLGLRPLRLCVETVVLPFASSASFASMLSTLIHRAAHRLRYVAAHPTGTCVNAATLAHSIDRIYQVAPLRPSRPWRLRFRTSLASLASFASRLYSASLVSPVATLSDCLPRSASPHRSSPCSERRRRHWSFIRHRCAAPVTFFVRAKKVTKEIAPRFGAKLINRLVPLCFSPRSAAAQLTRRRLSWKRPLRVQGVSISTAPLVRQCSPTTPTSPAMLGASHGSKFKRPRSIGAAVAVDTRPHSIDIEPRATDAPLPLCLIPSRPLRLGVEYRPSFAALAHRVGSIYRASTLRPLRLCVETLVLPFASSASFASMLSVYAPRRTLINSQVRTEASSRVS